MAGRTQTPGASGAKRAVGTVGTVGAAAVSTADPAELTAADRLTGQQLRRRVAE